MKVKCKKKISTYSFFIDSIGGNFENRFSTQSHSENPQWAKNFFTLITRFDIQLHVKIIKLTHTNQNMAKNGQKLDIIFLFTFPIIFFCETKFVKSDTVKFVLHMLAFFFSPRSLHFQLCSGLFLCEVLESGT